VEDEIVCWIYHAPDNNHATTAKIEPLITAYHRAAHKKKPPTFLDSSATTIQKFEKSLQAKESFPKFFPFRTEHSLARSTLCNCYSFQNLLSESPDRMLDVNHL